MVSLALMRIAHMRQSTPRSSHESILRWRGVVGSLVLSTVAALIILTALPTGHSAARTLQQRDTVSGLEQQMFIMINNDRAARGKPPLTWNAALATGARTHSLVMIFGCGLQHQCPSEPAPGTRISNEIPGWTSWGENIGYAGGFENYSNDIQVVEQSMINEGSAGGHYRNLMSTAFTQVGVGIGIDGQGYVWVTEDFVQSV